jgi:hypothetical protein
MRGVRGNSVVSPDFSEFQFGYGVTKELHRGKTPFNTFGQPMFPTQNQEEDLGFDVGFLDNASPLLIQYKRSDQLTTGNAREEREHDYSTPYYRFKTRTSNDISDPSQHEILTDVADHIEHTYYVAPKFTSWEEYRHFAAGDRISYNSAFISCKDAPTPFDNEDHYICYRDNSQVATFFSEKGVELDLYSNIIDLYESNIDETEFIDLYRSIEEAKQTVLEYIGPGEYYGEYAYKESFDLKEHTTRELAAWARRQQRFFFDSIGCSLEFIKGVE